ncbi:Autophagy-related protein [Wickerhamomyces ciferrii]|uniref:Autophagy-related protein n=1 Tax=Wickerhamomyces ciferrii (strain ATCC 14091 / BCRC 22168 / CBS 111 / JCM 3599 / NBRC 0793 / NRRL Y-1031 F-60-10) TaxID=1206466 RepID=K0KKT0_WICCF|nr:Autophagy-related protein [Wickerhamomyces ciferrii]CCH45795.1 Autophagy-related protein [Wickerhamomyces ciferrii]
MDFDSFNYTDFNTITNDHDFINSYIDLEKFSIPLDEDNNTQDQITKNSDFNNELYQILSKDSLTNTSISSPSASSSSSASFNSINYQFQSSNITSQPEPLVKTEETFDINSFLKNDDALNYLDSFSSPLESIESPLVFDQRTPNLNNSNTNNLSFTSNPYHNQQNLDFQSRPNTPTSLASSISSPITNANQNNLLHNHNINTTRRNLSISSMSSSNSPSSSSSSIKKNLDSRLSLQKLGEILQTSSLDETIKIEQFILKIFQDELGFPLGYKTWIRDTNEEYRRFLIEELYNRVNPKYPSMTKNLLETVVKRATYSMMQGRLRKERRAAIKKKRNNN